MLGCTMRAVHRTALLQAPASLECSTLSPHAALLRAGLLEQPGGPPCGLRPAAQPGARLLCAPPARQPVARPGGHFGDAGAAAARRERLRARARPARQPGPCALQQGGAPPGPMWPHLLRTNCSICGMLIIESVSSWCKMQHSLKRVLAVSAVGKKEVLSAYHHLLQRCSVAQSLRACWPLSKQAAIFFTKGGLVSSNPQIPHTF